MNVKKKIILEQLADYFMDKGKFLTYREYKMQPDAPIRHVLVPRLVGPWPRIEPLIARAFPEKYEIIKAGGVVTEEAAAQAAKVLAMEAARLKAEEKLKTRVEEAAAEKAEKLAKLKKGADDEANE